MTGELRTFAPGESVVIREVLNNQVWTVRPVTVIEDTDIHFASWLAPGTLIDYPVGVEHGEKCISMWLSGEWTLEPKVFLPPGMLRIAQFGAPFEVFATMKPEGGVASWYVNFQQPLVRTSIGFDTMDEILDLEVRGDFSSWARKDSDELELAVRMGYIDNAAANRLSDACTAVEESLSRAVVPWDKRCANWEPPQDKFQSAHSELQSFPS